MQSSTTIVTRTERKANRCLTKCRKIDPSTLKVSNSGSLIYPKHVHHALHRYLGIDDFAAQVGYGFLQTEQYDFFNPNLIT
jgi:hypothetical protein